MAQESGGAVVVCGCWVGRYGIEETPLWRAADDGQVETARRLLAGRDGESGEGKRWDHTLVAGGRPELLRSGRGAPGAPRRCEQGEIRRVHSTIVRCAKGLRPGGHVVPCKGRQREQGREGGADTALHCQSQRPQGRGGDRAPT